MDIIIGISLIITGLIYRVAPVWTTINWRYLPITAISIGILQILILVIIKQELEYVLTGCVFIGLGALLLDLGIATSRWFRRPQTITLILGLIVISSVIYLFAFNQDLLSFLAGPIMVLVIMFWIFRIMKKNLKNLFR